MSPRDPASLCLGCGVCCSGAFFEWLTVRPHEMERVSRRLPVVGDKVRLPCAAHTADMRCGIHAERPAVCAEYFCEVVRAVEAGKLSFEEAEALILRLKEAFRSLRGKIPGDGNLRQDIARFVVESPEWRRAHADLLLETEFFLELVDRFVVPQPPRASG